MTVQPYALAHRFGTDRPTSAQGVPRRVLRAPRQDARPNARLCPFPHRKADTSFSLWLLLAAFSCSLWLLRVGFSGFSLWAGPL